METPKTPKLEPLGRLQGLHERTPRISAAALPPMPGLNINWAREAQTPVIWVLGLILVTDEDRPRVLAGVATWQAARQLARRHGDARVHVLAARVPGEPSQAFWDAWITTELGLTPTTAQDRRTLLSELLAIGDPRVQGLTQCELAKVFRIAERSVKRAAAGARAWCAASDRGASSRRVEGCA